MKNNINLSIDCGENIYHYTSPDGLRSILESEKLWFTHYLGLNDKTEGIYIEQIIKDVIKESIYENDFRNLVLCAILNARDLEGFVCCFSRDSDSVHLWNEYTKTKNHFGYNIEISVSDLQRNIYNILHYRINNFYVVPIIYDKAFQTRLVKSIIDKYYYEWQKGHRILISKKLSAEISVFKYILKNAKFKVENEIRCLIMINKMDIEILKHGEKEIIKFRDVKGKKVAYIEIPVDMRKNTKRITISPIGVQNKEKTELEYLCNNLGLNCNIVNSKINVTNK